jgi:hypothetical protein
VVPRYVNFSKLIYLQGVSEIRVLILTSGRTRQFMSMSMSYVFHYHLDLTDAQKRVARYEETTRIQQK